MAGGGGGHSAFLQKRLAKGKQIVWAIYPAEELPAVRKTQPITKKIKISSTTHVHCFNGYMVNNNNMRG